MAKLDQKQIFRRRQRAVKTYDQAAIVQREVMDRLLERLDYMLIKPESVLNIGVAPDYGAGLLQTLYPDANVLSICSAEGENLPLQDHSQDLVIVHLVLHWMNDPQQFLKEIVRVLHPKGVLLLTAMGLDTLIECRSAFAQIDDAPHVHDFLDMHDVGDMLLQEGFTDPVVDMQTITVNYKTVQQLFSDLKDLGATNAHVDRRRGLMGRKKWHKMLAAYETMKNEGAYPGTYEVIFGHAWGVRTQHQHQGETSISLAALEKILKP